MADRKNIIFIHGVVDVSKQWHRSRSFFESNGFNVHFYDYPTLKNNLDIPAIANGLKRFIFKTIGSSEYAIFAHSQGGLIAEWYDYFINDKHLERVVTIGTPYQGNTLPLMAPRTFLMRLPIGRKQIKDLACMSPILSTLLRKRMECGQNHAPLVSLISYSSKIFNIQSDGIVSVCAGNRNADYYMLDQKQIRSLTQVDHTATIYVKTNHLPLSMVRNLHPARIPNLFSDLILSAVNGNAVMPYHPFMPAQCVCVYPLKFKKSLQLSEGLKKIISRPTQDGKYIVAYFDVRSLEPFISIENQFVRLQPGKFTYLFEPDFLNTKT